MPLKTNLARTHTKAIHPKPSGYTCHSQHAEHRALACARPGDTIYVARFRQSDGQLAMAKPCRECMEKIVAAGIRRVYYTDEQGNWQRI